ncbi:MAG: prolyl oligopeptidase family serine peptidase [Lentisphaerae bacterium]|nr:prolyl oligopeptidase family serine peptidase [Lentisphaerota bacterium]
MKHLTWPMRIAVWVVVAALYLMAWRVWRYDPQRPLPVPPPTPVEARDLGQRLKVLALEERVRSWRAPDLNARQAAWLAAKAEYVLATSKVLDAKATLDEKARMQVFNDWRRLHRAATLSRLGALEIPEESGGRLRAYWSPIDSSLQTYSLAFPEPYDPAVSYPLIVSMHGHGWYRPFQGHPAPVFKGAFSLSPQGRGSTDYMALGEDDVLATIDEVCRDYPVDPDRVYLRGSSMGGTGSWHLGVHYASRFAGILPIAGNADHTAWQSRWGWNADFEGRNHELRRLVQEAQTARAFAGNLLNLPAYVLHGTADTVVPPEHARQTVAVLRALGCPVQYLEFPGVGHGGFPADAEAEALAWLCGQPRQAHPPRVRWSADLMRHGLAYWVRLEEKRQPLGLADIDAEVIDRNHVLIRTGNLRAVSLQRDAVLLQPGRPIFVDIDGERVIFPPGPANAWMGLRYLDGVGWRDASLLPTPPLRKTAGLEGPIQEALHAPFVIVLGTRSPDPLKRRLWEDEVRRFATDWKRRNLAPCPFIRDVECTAEIAAERNLILFGGPEDNTVAAVLEARLPIARVMRPLSASADPAHSSSTDRWGLSAPDVGWFMAYPNPEHPNRLVVILAAGGPQAIYQAWGRFGNWFNWGVHDSRKYFDYAVYDALSAGPESLRLVGWFGTDWTVEAGSWWIGNDAVRARLAPQGFPAYEQAPSDVAEMDLADLRPDLIDQMRGAVGVGRSFFGQPLRGALGLRAPAVLEYDLDGTWRSLSTGATLHNSTEATLLPSRARSEQVRFIIKGDGRDLAAASVTWERPDVHLIADLRGVKRLRLEAVCTGGPAWLHMGAAWTQPRLRR